MTQGGVMLRAWSSALTAGFLLCVISIRAGLTTASSNTAGVGHTRLAVGGNRVLPMCTALVWEEGAQSGYPAAREKVDTERECDDFFIEWVPGFSARDHREMLDRQRLLAREDDRDAAMLARADRLDAAQREWQEKQEREAERRHQEQTDAADKRHKGELEAARGRQWPKQGRPQAFTRRTCRVRRGGTGRSYGCSAA